MHAMPGTQSWRTFSHGEMHDSKPGLAAGPSVAVPSLAGCSFQLNQLKEGCRFFPTILFRGARHTQFQSWKWGGAPKGKGHTRLYCQPEGASRRHRVPCSSLKLKIHGFRWFQLGSNLVEWGIYLIGRRVHTLRGGRCVLQQACLPVGYLFIQPQTASAFRSRIPKLMCR